MTPLNGHYIVKFIKEEEKQGMFILPKEEGKIRKAKVIAIPLDNQLKISLDDVVLAMYNYSHELSEGNFLVKGDYILAKETP